MDTRLLTLGLAIPEILLPRDSADLSRWAIIACDQFTQDRAYWDHVRKAVGDHPSTLNLVFPEVYLENDDRKKRIASIHRAMDSYLAEGVFAPPFKGCVYVERSTPYHKRRRGLIIAVDLDRYDWTGRAKALIRATEGTVPERLPPRMDIRRGASLESPHILVLVDDDKDTLLPGLAALLRHLEPRYRGSLMLDSGTVTGWALDREEHWAFIAEQFEELYRRAESRYSGNDSPFLYAVGDGNHSLATAKGIWEEYKKVHQGESGLMEHPARFALVEIENIYDPGIGFEPIHRILFNASIDDVIDTLALLPEAAVYPVEGNATKLCEMVRDQNTTKGRLGLISGSRMVLLENEAPGLATVSLQPLLDRFVVRGAAAGGGSPSIDYIHGEEELIRLATTGKHGDSAVGIILPPIRKDGLFETVARSGPLPRKSFSMGEAVEKRFYLECRKLFG
ncbi:MAG: DUF1015 domain-containing protein [Treponema sp.]|jgi:hypothetical protein|nr:DUF1015 domain-containing protein [Treponema sp.]